MLPECEEMGERLDSKCTVVESEQKKEQRKENGRCTTLQQIWGPRSHEGSYWIFCLRWALRERRANRQEDLSC